VGGDVELALGKDEQRRSGIASADCPFADRPAVSRMVIALLLLVQGSSPAGRRSHELRTSSALLLFSGRRSLRSLADSREGSTQPRRDRAGPHCCFTPRERACGSGRTRRSVLGSSAMRSRRAGLSRFHAATRISRLRARALLCADSEHAPGLALAGSWLAVPAVTAAGAELDESLLADGSSCPGRPHQVPASPLKRLSP
jgi:hypothetical protein